MERRRIKVGQEVKVRPAGGRSLARRPAKILAFPDRPGYRRNRVLIRYVDDTPEVASVLLARVERA